MASPRTANRQLGQPQHSTGPKPRKASIVPVSPARSSYSPPKNKKPSTTTAPASANPSNPSARRSSKSPNPSPRPRLKRACTRNRSPRTRPTRRAPHVRPRRPCPASIDEALSRARAWVANTSRALWSGASTAPLSGTWRSSTTCGWGSPPEILQIGSDFSSRHPPTDRPESAHQ
jgi:hypothetical protein